jgi:hypothetical protein
MVKDKYPIVILLLIILWIVAMGKAGKQFADNQSKQITNTNK